MCEHQRKLVAWLDQELGHDESAEMERHVESCAECRRLAAVYKQVGAAVVAYADEMAAASDHGKAKIWQAGGTGMALRAGAAAAVAIALLIFLVPRGFYSHGVNLHIGYSHIGYSHGVTPKTQLHTQQQPAVTSRPAPTVQEPSQEAALSPATTAQTARRRKMPVVAKNRYAGWPPNEDEPGITIAIPGDAMFPPGAVPEGVDFVAELNVAPEGWARQLRMQPELVTYQRRTR